MPRIWGVALCWIVCLSAPAMANQREALVIANQNYPEQLGALTHTHAHADRVAQTLSGIGFNVQVIVDASKSDIIQETDLFAQRLAQGGDSAVGLLYYTGHGAADWETGRNFLIPADAAAAPAEALWNTSIPMTQLRSILTETAPRADYFVVVDASHRELTIAAEDSLKGFASEVVDDVLMLLSTSPAALAPAIAPDVEIGPFVTAFTEELRADASDVGGLIQRVQRSVMVRTNNTQHPYRAPGFNRSISLYAATAQQQQVAAATQTRSASDRVTVPILDRAAAPPASREPRYRASIIGRPPAPPQPAPQAPVERQVAARTVITQSAPEAAAGPADALTEDVRAASLVTEAPVADVASDAGPAPISLLPDDASLATGGGAPAPANSEPREAVRLVAPHVAVNLSDQAVRDAFVGGLVGPTNQHAYAAAAAVTNTDLSLDWRNFADLGLPTPEVPEPSPPNIALRPADDIAVEEQELASVVAAPIAPFEEPTSAAPLPDETETPPAAGADVPLGELVSEEAPIEEVTPEIIRDVQTILIAMGYLSNATTGEIDAATRGAAAAFRADQRDFTSSDIDAALLATLSDALANGVSAPPPIDLAAATPRAPQQPPATSAGGGEGMFIRPAPRSDMAISVLEAPTSTPLAPPPNQTPQSATLEPVYRPAPPAQPRSERKTPGDVFSECGSCPQMIVIPTGSFVMGTTEGQMGHEPSEGPQRRVSIDNLIAVGRFEVTWEEWGVCVAAGWCQPNGPDSAGGDEGWGRGIQPVINVAYSDALSYVAWLNSLPGVSGYRLLSEAEWEYAARAGSSAAYSWGDAASHQQANYGADICCDGLTTGADRWVNSAPVGSFGANAFGLYDMHGNVAEWVIDCWSPDYIGAPTNGSARLDGCEASYVVARGGSWLSTATKIRASQRERVTMAARNSHIGFRIARTMQD